jgi:hypothetical protein
MQRPTCQSRLPRCGVTRVSVGGRHPRVTTARMSSVGVRWPA